MPPPYLDLSRPSAPGAVASAVAHAIERGEGARRTVDRSDSAIVATVHSTKMGRAFSTDSGLEADALILADVLEDVVAFRPQAVELRYRADGSDHRAFPDMAVRRLDGTVELWEVKPARPRAGTFERLVQIGSALREHGIPYRVMTPVRIRRHPQLANARLLHWHGSRKLPEAISDRLADAVAEQDLRTFGDLQRATGLGAEYLLTAAAQGVFAVDISGERLGGEARIRPAKPKARSGGWDASQGSKQ